MVKIQRRAAQTLLVFSTALIALAASTGCSGLTSAGSSPAQSNKPSGSGSAGTTQLTVSSTALNFGNVAIGATNAQQVTVTNTGTTNVTVSENAVSGAGFTASGIGSGLILNPTQTGTLNVTFSPVSAGQASGLVPLVSSAWTSPVNIVLTGMGTQPVQAGTHTASLSWNPSTSAVAGYNAYRGTQAGGPYTKLNSSLVLGTSYADATVQSGQVYFYMVTSQDSLNTESTPSNEVSATIP